MGSERCIRDRYTFYVKCGYVYDIEADSEEEARKILIRDGGLDITGTLCLEEEDYKNADLV